MWFFKYTVWICKVTHTWSHIIYIHIHTEWQEKGYKQSMEWSLRRRAHLQFTCWSDSVVCVSVYGSVIFSQFRLSSLLWLPGASLTSPHTPSTLLTQIHSQDKKNTHTDADRQMWERWQCEWGTAPMLCACLCVWDWGLPLWMMHSRWRDPLLWVCAKRSNTLTNGFCVCVCRQTKQPLRNRFHKVIQTEKICQFCPSHYHKLSLLCLICAVLSACHKSFISLLCCYSVFTSICYLTAHI